MPTTKKLVIRVVGILEIVAVALDGCLYRRQGELMSGFVLRHRKGRDLNPRTLSRQRFSSFLHTS